jgi:hypothetical protein
MVLFTGEENIVWCGGNCGAYFCHALNCLVIAIFVYTVCFSSGCAEFLFLLSRCRMPDVRRKHHHCIFFLIICPGLEGGELLLPADLNF